MSRSNRNEALYWVTDFKLVTVEQPEQPLPLFVYTLIESTQPLSIYPRSDKGSTLSTRRWLLGAWLLCNNIHAMVVTDIGVCCVSRDLFLIR